MFDGYSAVSLNQKDVLCGALKGSDCTRGAFRPIPRVMPSAFENLRLRLAALTSDGAVTADERAFADSYIIEKRTRDAATSLVMAGAFSVVGITAGFLFTLGVFKMQVVLTFLSGLALDLAWLRIRRSGLSVRLYAAIVQMYSAASMALLAALAQSGLTSSVRLTLAPSVFAGLTCATLIGFPYSTRAAAVAALGYLAMNAPAYYTDNFSYLTMIAIFLTPGVMIHGSVGRRARASAIREYRSRLLLAPASIVRRSLRAKLSLDQVFSPKVRACACVSTDLREYGAVLGRLHGDGMNEYLSAIYTRTQALLQRHVPGGNYYADWIAGELFIVIYAEDGSDDPRPLVASAVALAVDLIGSTEAITADVGIACGPAFVGMMGPPGNRKATALGETPGRARRFQGSGGAVRVHLGTPSLLEMRTLALIAPALIARKSLEADVSPTTLFGAKVRSCVCVSSDWRSYQRLSGELTPQELAQTLADYYAVCEGLLDGVAPGGNYYYDWIADELFVVFFALAADGVEELPALALAFGRRLLDAKPAFVRTHKAPGGIDVGIGAGTVLVGLLGAPGLSKATAVGDTPARARQLQLVAKALRKQLGDEDRIVFGAELLAAAPGAEPVPLEVSGEELCFFVPGRPAA